jgi:hypothetical protein
MAKQEQKMSVIIDQVADTIRLHGWQRGGGWWLGHRSPGRLCLEGALQKVLGIEHTNGRARDTFMMHPAYVFLQEQLGTPNPLHTWNDDWCRSEAHLMDVLHRASAKAKVLEDKAERETMKNKRKFSIKALLHAMNEEMDEFEESIQTSTFTSSFDVEEKQKELINA